GSEGDRMQRRAPQPLDQFDDQQRSRMFDESRRDEADPDRTARSRMLTGSETVAQRCDLRLLQFGEVTRAGQLLRWRGLLHEQGKRRDAGGAAVDTGQQALRQWRQLVPVANASLQERQLRQGGPEIRLERQPALVGALRFGEIAL